MALEHNTKIRVPPKVRRGEAFAVRCLIMHPMENGRRLDADGRLVPIDIIHTFECRYAGQTVFRAEMGTGVSANPYLTFYVAATESGPMEFTWHGDDGSVSTALARIEVE